MEIGPLSEELLRLQVPLDDQMLVENVVGAMRALCTSWKLDSSPTGYTIRGTLHPDNFEISLHQMQLLSHINPVRVDNISVVRVASRNELVVQLLNASQPVAVRTNRILVLTQTTKRMKFF